MFHVYGLMQVLTALIWYITAVNNREAPVIISDKLSDDETQRLLTVLEKHCIVLGYSL